MTNYVFSKGNLTGLDPNNSSSFKKINKNKDQIVQIADSGDHISLNLSKTVYSLGSTEN
jgi:hypothetical protein